MIIKTKEQLQKYLSDKSAPYDVFQIARDIGIKVTDDLDWDKLGNDGQIYLNDKDQPEIWINPTSNINRRTFTLAHELGHLFNDVLPDIEKFKSQDPIFDDYKTLQRNGNTDRKEVLANKFAAELLMPIKDINKIGADVIDKYQKKYGKGKRVPKDKFIIKMAVLFKVSKNTTRFRLKNIGLFE